MATKTKNAETKEMNYSVELIEKSDGLTAEQVLNCMNTDTLEKISNRVGETIEIVGRVHTHVSNPYADGDNEYDQFIYINADGEAFYTGSQSFDSSYRMIADNMDKLGLTGNPKIEVIEKPSKNNAGNMYLAKASF